MLCRFIALAAAAAAAPAAAQISVGGQAGVGANLGVGVDTGRTVDSLDRTLDRTVDSTDRTLNRTVNSDVGVATRADIVSGATVRDSRGRRVGTVQAVHGDTAIVVRNGQRLNVPVASLYHGGRGLVTRMSRAQLHAAATADARAAARAHD
jgi:hypothetical protein